MKNYIAILLLILSVGSLSAESVWTGNAAAGVPGDFSVLSDLFQASSNTFPAGTMVRVTNPRGGASVDVEVVGRLSSPGVFILIEERAAAAIGIPTGQVVSVRVTPLLSNAEPDMSPGLLETAYPAVETETEAEAEAPPGAVAESVPVSTDPVPGKPEEIIAYGLDNEGDGVTEAEAADDFVVDEGSGKIFFLMPADLRPPDAPAATVALDPIPLPAADNFDFEIYRVLPGDTRAYVQIGAYRNRSRMEDAARWIATFAPGYPVGMAIAVTGSGEVYKLLLGPLKPAERGVVLRTAKTTVFPDAFPYKP